MNQARTAGLKRTPLYTLHKELKGRMVPFAGYEMPVQFPAGIRAEHAHTRDMAGLFDISHMGQIVIVGENVAVNLEKLVPGDIQGLSMMHQRYTVFTNNDGGILDDLMVTRMADHHFLVVNAACKDSDFNYLEKSLGSDYKVTMLVDKALLAIQGPAASTVLSRFHPQLGEIPFLSAENVNLSGVACLIHRCGYTGEDGYEISVDAKDAETLARILLEQPEVMPIGLGARDTLRLEAGLCLYGYDLDNTTTPIEADMAWLIGRKYRVKNPVPAGFPGAAIILSQLSAGSSRIRKGFRPQGRIPVREGATIFERDGVKVGIITSGGYGQTVGGPIAMGYVDSGSVGHTDYHVEIRKQKYDLINVDLPFVEHRYYK